MKNKTSLFFTAIFLAGLLVICPQASASFTFDEIKMVGADLSTIEQEVFGRDETPWLYLKLPESPFGGPWGDLNITFSFWHDPDNTVYFQSGGFSADRENWISLPNWNTIRMTGEWDVSASYIGLSGIGSGSTSFTVTPEPVSTILFLIGSMPVALELYRRKRSKKI